MKIKSRFIFGMLITIILLSVPTMALAKGLMQDATPAQTPNASVILLDMALMATITAFIKQNFGVTGKPVIAVAFGVGVILWGAPLISAAYPAIGVYLDSFLAFIKVWLGAMGSVDLVQTIGANMAKVKTKAAAK